MKDLLIEIWLVGAVIVFFLVWFFIWSEERKEVDLFEAIVRCNYISISNAVAWPIIVVGVIAFFLVFLVFLKEPQRGNAG